MLAVGQKLLAHQEMAVAHHLQVASCVCRSRTTRSSRTLVWQAITSPLPASAASRRELLAGAACPLTISTRHCPHVPFPPQGKMQLLDAGLDRRLVNEVPAGHVHSDISAGKKVMDGIINYICTTKTQRLKN